MTRLLIATLIATLALPSAALAQGAALGGVREAARNAGQPKGAKQKVERAVLDLSAAMQTDDPQKRSEAVRKMMPVRDDLEALFGATDGGTLFEAMQPAVEKFVAASAANPPPPFGTVEAVDVRTDRASQRLYAAVLDRIPNDVPVFRVTVRGDQRASGLSSFVVLADRVVWIRGLERAPQALR